MRMERDRHRRSYSSERDRYFYKNISFKNVPFVYVIINFVCITEKG